MRGRVSMGALWEGLISLGAPAVAVSSYSALGMIANSDFQASQLRRISGAVTEVLFSVTSQVVSGN